MAGADYANSYLVTMAGAPLAIDVAALLTAAWVEQDERSPAAFVLRFHDPDRIVIQKARATIGSPVEISVETSQAAAPELLIRGEITAMEAEVDVSGSITILRGYDKAHRLRRGRVAAVFPAMTYSEIVRKVCTQYGMTAARIEPTTARPLQVSRGTIDAWSFLTDLADEIGFVLYVDEHGLNFHQPTDAAGAAASITLDTTDLVAIRAVVSAAEQVQEVSVRSWDGERKKVLVAKGTAKKHAAKVALDPAAATTVFENAVHTSKEVRYPQDAMLTTAAEALADRLSSGFAELDGVARGNPHLRAGQVIALHGLGDPFDGKYRLTRTRHTFDPDTGYTTQIAVTPRDAPAPDARTTSEMTGLVIGLVTDIKDPLQLGRVRMKLPTLSEDCQTGWAPTVQAGAGRSRGTLILPEVNDQVLVGFEEAQLDRPYVLGGLYSTVDKPALNPVGVGGVVSRAFTSRQGHTLLFDETGAEGGILLRTGDNTLDIGLNTKTTQIRVHSDGSVAIDAANGVKISGGRGAIELAGNSISLKALTRVTIEGSSVEATAQGPVSMRGATASVEATAAMRIVGGSLCAISGQLVKIN